jgi:hypothetical protein
MNDETKPDPEVIPPAATDEQAFYALMSAVDKDGISEIAYRLLRSPVLFDPARARVNAHAIATALRKAANSLVDATRPPGQPRVRELYSIHGEASGIWFCEKCRYTCRNEEDATSCCAPRVCDKCETPMKVDSYFCDLCWRKEQAEKAAALWAKAEAIPADAYVGEMIYVEDDEGSAYGGSHEGYFHSVEELWEHVEDEIEEGDPIPILYVYATSPTKMSFCDAWDEIDSALERGDFFDGARDQIPSEAGVEFQAFLDQWVAKYSPTAYFPDYKKKITGWDGYVPDAEESESSDDDEQDQEADA